MTPEQLADIAALVAKARERADLYPIGLGDSINSCLNRLANALEWVAGDLKTNSALLAHQHDRAMDLETQITSLTAERDALKAENERLKLAQNRHYEMIYQNDDLRVAVWYESKQGKPMEYVEVSGQEYSPDQLAVAQRIRLETQQSPLVERMSEDKIRADERRKILESLAKDGMGLRTMKRGELPGDGNEK